MTPADAALVLAKCAAFDNRTVGRSDAQAWAEALDGVPFAEAMRAVGLWYRDNRERIMPADVRRIVTTEAHDNARRIREAADDRRLALEAARAVPFEDAPPEARALIAAFRADNDRRRPGKSRAVVRLAHILAPRNTGPAKT